MTPSDGAPRPRRNLDPFAAFLAYLGEIEQAVLNRNWSQLAASLRRRSVSHLPREVREELLLLTRSSRSSMRAPVHFLRFRHRMTQLALGGDAMPTAQTEFDLLEQSHPPRSDRAATPGQRVAARDGVRDPDES